MGEQSPRGSFQSRSGFSVRRDAQIPRTAPVAPAVSIPVWVFSPSRQILRAVLGGHDSCFNPGLGFQSVATVSNAPAGSLLTSTPVSFNPGLGFQSVATGQVY